LVLIVVPALILLLEQAKEYLSHHARTFTDQLRPTEES
jgi:hypothetical protein